MITHDLTAVFLQFSDSRYVPQLMGTKFRYCVNNILHNEQVKNKWLRINLIQE